MLDTEYTTQPRGTPPRSLPRPAHTVIEAAKDAVPTIDLADLLCGPGHMRRIGERWTARCPLPDHEDKTPSFVVYPGDGGWWCYGCNRGGDVVSLAALAWDHERQDEAAACLLMEFGHEVPQRPPSWFRKQERQKRARESFDQGRTRITQRRVYKLLRAELDAIGGDEPDEDDREAMWAWAGIVAARMMKDRSAGTINAAHGTDIPGGPIPSKEVQQLG